MTDLDILDTDLVLIIDCTSIFWTLMGVIMPQRLTVLLDRKL